VGTRLVLRAVFVGSRGLTPLNEIDTVGFQQLVMRSIIFDDVLLCVLMLDAVLSELQYVTLLK